MTEYEKLKEISKQAEEGKVISTKGMTRHQFIATILRSH